MNDYGLEPGDPLPPPRTVFFEYRFNDRHETIRMQISPPYITRCQAKDDGCCDWSCCPQHRDGEPERTGRFCPLFCGLEAEYE